MQPGARPSRKGTPRPILTLAGPLPIMVNKLLMRAMNRLSPLISRQVGPRALALPADAAQPDEGQDAAAAAWLDDLKLFATGWVGGLVFFGTLLG
jgi:hypothetical protein